MGTQILTRNGLKQCLTKQELVSAYDTIHTHNPALVINYEATLGNLPDDAVVANDVGIAKYLLGVAAAITGTPEDVVPEIKKIFDVLSNAEIIEVLEAANTLHFLHHIIKIPAETFEYKQFVDAARTKRDTPWKLMPQNVAVNTIRIIMINEILGAINVQQA